MKKIFIYPVRALIGASLAFFGVSTTTLAREMSVGIPGNAPFTGLESGKIKGVIAQAAAETLTKLGCTGKGMKLPFPRMYKYVHKGEIDIATSVLKTPPRAVQAHYTSPIITEYTLVMVPKGKGFPLRTAKDLEGKRIGGQLGFKYPPLNGTTVKLIRERSYTVNILKIAKGKIDGALIGSVTGRYLVRKMGLEDKIEFLPRALGKVGLGAALSRTSFSPDQLKQFDRELASLMESDRWREILLENEVLDLVRPWPIAMNGIARQ